MDRAPLGRGRALALLAVALVLSMTTWFSATAVVPQLREDWGLSDTAAAWLTIAVQLGFVAGALVSSVLNLADVLSARAVLLAGAGGAAAANTLLVVVDSAAAALPLRFATGFFLAGVYPPALKLMSTWFQRGRGTDWRTVIVATSALTLAGGLLAFTVVREGPYPFPRATFAPRQAH
ncbi:MAG: MFS transporter, partial [Gaiellaceae bacterium]